MNSLCSNKNKILAKKINIYFICSVFDVESLEKLEI